MFKALINYAINIKTLSINTDKRHKMIGYKV